MAIQSYKSELKALDLKERTCYNMRTRVLGWKGDSNLSFMVFIWESNTVTKELAAVVQKMLAGEQPIEWWT